MKSKKTIKIFFIVIKKMIFENTENTKKIVLEIGTKQP